MFGIKNPYYEYLRYFHPPRFSRMVFVAVLGAILLKWCILLISVEGEGGLGLILIYCSGLELFLIPILPLVTTALVARHIAFEAQKDMFEATLLTTLPGDKIVQAFIRLLALPYLGIATVIEFDNFFFLIWLISVSLSEFDSNTSVSIFNIEFRLLGYFLLYFFLMWFPMARAVQMLHFLMGLFYGFKFKRPIYAMSASVFTGIILLFMFGCGWSITLNTFNEPGLTLFWVCTSTVSFILWFFVWKFLSSVYDTVREV